MREHMHNEEKYQSIHQSINPSKPYCNMEYEKVWGEGGGSNLEGATPRSKNCCQTSQTLLGECGIYNQNTLRVLERNSCPQLTTSQTLNPSSTNHHIFE
jgi:hypothetical protein